MQRNLKQLYMLSAIKKTFLNDISATIPKKYYLKGKESLRIWYHAGRKIRYINLLTPQDVAAFLKKHQVIHSYALVGKEVRMFRLHLVTTVGKKGQPVQEEHLLPFLWDEIEISRESAHAFAIINEFELANNTLGKVIRNIFKAA